MSDYAPILQEAGKRYNIDPDLLTSMAQVESGFRPDAKSPAGALGVMQLMPATAAARGVKDPYDAPSNIMGGAAELSDLVKKYGNIDHAVMAYNWGQGNFDKYLSGEYKSVPQETSKYLDKVSSAFNNYKSNAGVNTSPQNNGSKSFSDSWIGGSSQEKGQQNSFDSSSWLGETKQAQNNQQQTQPKAQSSGQFIPEIGRQIGLTGRAAATGITAIPGIVGDALNTAINYGIEGVNSALDSKIPKLGMPSAELQKGMNAIGVPSPQNGRERVVQDIASAMASVTPSTSLGESLSKSGRAAVSAIGKGMSYLPGMQLAGAAGSAAAGGAAREEGFSPAAQIGASLLGGAAGVVGSSAATSGLRTAANALAKPPVLTAEQANNAAHQGVKKVIEEMGDAGRLVTPAEIAAMEAKAASQIGRTPGVDAAALVRSQDFSELGMQPTLGQITRDPAQFSREKNDRGLDLGAQLLSRFTKQDKNIQSRISSLQGNPSDTFQAGDNLSSALKNIDDKMRLQVNYSYKSAKESSGKNLNVPLSGIAQDYSQVIHDFAEKVPGGVRNQFSSLGVTGESQKKTFTIDDAENVLKVINDNFGIDQATNTALGKLRDSVRNAILEADDQGGVYAKPRELAAARFKLQDAIPALKAASDGTVAPDDFVRKFVVGGKVNDVKQLANLLKQNSPEAFEEARSQIGKQLKRAAGDSPFSPVRYAEALTKIGPQKLNAFYSPEEVSEFQRIGRVGAYMNSQPSGSFVNNSNTAAALASMAGNAASAVPIFGPLVANPLANALKNYSGRKFVNSALSATVPKANASAVSDRNNALSRLMFLGTLPNNPGSQ